MAKNPIVSKLLRMKILGATLAGAAVIFVAGIVFWGAFNTAMEATNTMTFCISCHEMRDNVFQEYKKTIHYTNRSGVQATCSDCHVPRDWVHKTIRKIQASGELLHKALGSVDTPEKFDAKRLVLAKRVWATMKGSDSRECRNCHAFDQMNPDMQKQRARKQHENAKQDGNTCIDCHKGIAHKPVHQLVPEEEMKELEKPVPAAKTVQAPAPAPAAKQAAPSAAPVAASSAATSGPLTSASVDWSKVSEAKTVLFYPGQTGIEWVLTGTEHGGARAYKKGDNCAGCHKEETSDMGTKMVTGTKAETKPIPGKRPAIPLQIKAAYDASNLYMRFEFPAGAAGAGPRMDGQNEIKLAMMIDQGKVDGAARNGCWATCHMDARDMPNAPAGKTVTKYVAESRTQLDTTKRDNWDKLKPQAEIDALLAGGTFMDLTRFMSSGASEQGYVLAERVLNPAKDVAYTGKKEGDKWVVTMVRRLKGSQPGEVMLEPGKAYAVGFAIHDDYTNGRFHHVSVDMQLGLGAEGDIKASKL